MALHPSFHHLMNKREAATAGGALNIDRLQDEPRATVLVACTKSLGWRHHQVRKLRQEVGKKKGEGRRQDDSKR
jgi:hypothetical protein